LPQKGAEGAKIRRIERELGEAASRPVFDRNANEVGICKGMN
jgi:hypothetical protein